MNPQESSDDDEMISIPIAKKRPADTNKSVVTSKAASKAKACPVTPTPKKKSKQNPKTPKTPKPKQAPAMVPTGVDPKMLALPTLPDSPSEDKRPPSLKLAPRPCNHSILHMKDYDASYFRSPYIDGRVNFPQTCSGVCGRIFSTEKKCNLHEYSHVGSGKDVKMCLNALDEEHECLYALCKQCTDMAHIVEGGKRTRYVQYAQATQPCNCFSHTSHLYQDPAPSGKSRRGCDGRRCHRGQALGDLKHNLLHAV